MACFGSLMPSQLMAESGWRMMRDSWVAGCTAPPRGAVVIGSRDGYHPRSAVRRELGGADDEGRRQARGVVQALGSPV
jgi:hypothetical protein